MADVLIDSNTYIDFGKAHKHLRRPWALNTLRHMATHRTAFGKPAMSVLTVVEILKGLHRSFPEAVLFFQERVAVEFEVIDFDVKASFLAGEITARLEAERNSIGLADSLIAATAIQQNLVLATSNLRHFQRITDMGYPLRVENWREA